MDYTHRSGERAEGFEIDWLKQWALYSPASVALQDGETGRSYTYFTLYVSSCQIAAYLRDRFGVRAGHRIAVMATNELEYVALFFAAQRLGAILVPINFRLTAREVAHILEDSSPRLLVFQKQFSEVVAGVERGAAPELQWSFDEGEDSLSAFATKALALLPPAAATRNSTKPSWFVPMHGDVEAPCMILYTSGTTGAPKGALITYKMLHWNSLNTGLRLNLSQSDVHVSFLPFFHTGGWNVLVTPFLHRGARTILIKKFDPLVILQLSAKERATILFGVPTTMDMMARVPNFDDIDLRSIRYAIVGGEPMSIELIKTWEQKGIPVRQGYGLTEFGPSVFSLNEEDSVRKIGSIGFPNFYVQARVMRDDGGDCADGEIGELTLKGPVRTPGYWNNAHATAEAIRNGWFHTGDLVRRDSEGYFYVAGRKKDMYKSGGENVYPVEVESFLSMHPAIREVAVIGVADTKWGEVGKAFIALNPGAEMTAEDVIRFCQDGLARYKIPRSVEFRIELPKGDSGKILKRKLLET